jgi:GalNAc-alpha-(1->4)-GalNAc-alpha-(1->3)-diNAcBac-PP-undecaprenol alpha-1,4-N-acetyl-D-galactosaminyltransferase
MGTGLPCVVYDCPSGPHEITRGGQDALLVPLNDQAGLSIALQRLMDDAELRQSLGGRARDSVLGRYQLNAVLRQWDDVFKRVGIAV